MLLTSGQVSLAVSSVIVFICTAALFLSGYILQQRSLRDLRAAIKPSPRASPKVFLPDRFKYSTTELPDGTVIVLDNDDDAGIGSEGRAERGNPDMIEIRPSSPGGDARGSNPAPLTGKKGRPTKTAKSQAKNGKQGQAPADFGADESRQKPMSRAERRQRIREEIMRLSQGQEGRYYQRRRS
ncbi:hypothetical protein C7999DRAFT_15233 [Corynascus novoguineensis]|uniref:Uncharacterized protein n=1 Tax=Corynascus novoguineensis TaxID=1126955 RepID=A0AAN7CQZ5_9PEZI|nr:hypothetical protein C7999DRAFT_15233 [Corynascus novoguineensis]